MLRRHLVQNVLHVANLESDVIDNGTLGAGRRGAFVDDHQNLRQRVHVPIRAHLPGGRAHHVYPEAPLDLRILGEQMDVAVGNPRIGRVAALSEPEGGQRHQSSRNRNDFHFSQHSSGTHSIHQKV